MGFSWNNDNEAGSAAARGGLSALGNFLMANRAYKQIQKPESVANIAQSQANTAETVQDTAQKSKLFNDVTLPTGKLQTKQAENAESYRDFTPDLGSIPDPDVQNGIDAATKIGWNKPGGRQYAMLPYPQDEAAANQMGVNWFGDENKPDVWPIPVDKLPKPDYTGKYFAELPPHVQEAAISQYRKNAPHPEAVAPEDVAAAYDSRIGRLTVPPLNPATLGKAGLLPTKFSSQNGLEMERVFGGNGQNGGMPWAQWKEAVAPMMQEAATDPTIRDAWNIGTAAEQVSRMRTLAEDPKTTNPGVYDQSLVRSFVKSIDPTMRVGTGENTEPIWSIPLAQKYQAAVQKVLKGTGTLTPESRAAFEQAAWANSQAAVEQANGAIGWRNQTGKNAFGLPPVIPSINITPPSSARVGDSDVPGSSSSLPQVNPPRTVSNLGSTAGGNPVGNSPVSVSSQAEFNKLPKGTEFIWAPTGERGKK